jgi:hypothetical protein
MLKGFKVYSVQTHDDAHQFQGCKSCAVTTLGRGGSDLTATTIGKALGLREIQVYLLIL